jgi:ABC-type Fe3+ transport system permease subunit
VRGVPVFAPWLLALGIVTAGVLFGREAGLAPGDEVVLALALGIAVLPLGARGFAPARRATLRRDDEMAQMLGARGLRRFWLVWGRATLPRVAGTWLGLVLLAVLELPACWVAVRLAGWEPLALRLFEAGGEPGLLASLALGLLGPAVLVRLAGLRAAWFGVIDRA